MDVGDGGGDWYRVRDVDDDHGDHSVVIIAVDSVPREKTAGTGAAPGHEAGWVAQLGLDLEEGIAVVLVAVGDIRRCKKEEEGQRKR